MTYSYAQARPLLTVDAVVLGYTPGNQVPFDVLLVKRGREPFRHLWALPGGKVEVKDDGDQGEHPETAVRRELREETGIDVGALRCVLAFASPGRDPRGRVVSLAYTALTRPSYHALRAGDDAAEAEWSPVASDGRLVSDRRRLAFDHDAILRAAVVQLRDDLRRDMRDSRFDVLLFPDRDIAPQLDPLLAWLGATP